MDRGKVFGFPENRDEPFGLAPRVGDLTELVENNAPAYDREEDQQRQDPLHEGTRAENQVRHPHPAAANLVKHKPR
jgi:hypothetical protein